MAMHFHVITLFPEMVEHACSHGILGRAIKQGLINLSCWNPRDYTKDRHHTVDDRPYGGGPGMLMKVEPLADAIEAAKESASEDVKVVYLSPQGRTLKQDCVNQLSGHQDVILIAGRYEGIDERIIEQYVDEELSIGDYVLSGGEAPALIMIDAVARQLPGVLGDDESAQQDSFMKGLLDYPHYTRPEEINGKRVPAVLLSGDHKAIARWRQRQALGRTWLRRPDLLKGMQLDERQKQMLAEFQLEQGGVED
jgi:tRNA (guanine37-N1)-methyltransferase